MIKVLIGALLIATTAVAQTPKASSPKSASTSTNPSSGSATRSSRPARPLPNPSMKEKTKSGNTNIPSYQQEKDAGIHRTRNRYKPRRTDSGARKDTMKKLTL